MLLQAARACHLLLPECQVALAGLAAQRECLSRGPTVPCCMLVIG